MTVTNLRKVIVEKLFNARVDETVENIESFLPTGSTVLDLGAGTCVLTKLLRERGYTVKPVDIKNRSCYPDIICEIYDGEHLPFKKDQFTACILIAVLHHTPDPEVILKEAVRVSKRVIVYEDAVTNIFQRLYTYFIDSLLNKEFRGHPHTNKNDQEWKKLFNKMELKLIRTEYKKTWLFLYNPIYFLESYEK